MGDLKQNIRVNSVKHGVVFGVAILITGILSFYFITGMVSSKLWILVAPVIFSVLIPIGLVIFFSFNLRKEIGGFWSFRQAVTGIFIMFITAYAIQTIGRDLVFAKFIEPNMAQKTEVAMMEATTTMLEKTGASETQIDAKKADIQKQFDDQKKVTAGSIVQGIAVSIIFIFILSMIFAALFKRDAPFIADEQNNIHYADPTV